MRKKILFVSALLMIFGIISLSMTSAITYNAEVFEDKALIKIYFGDVNDLEFRLPRDIRVFELNIMNYELIDFEDYKILKVSKASNLEISYITNSMIDKTSKRNFFIFNNYFKEELESISLSLPKGAILGDLIVPNSDKVITDGRRIILQWENFSSEEIVVDYTFVKEQNHFWTYLLLVLIIAFIIFYFYKSKKFKKRAKILAQKNKSIKDKRKKDITRNLFGEEKKIIEYLLSKKKNESWTKELIRELGISKVRLSRKLRNLEQKELIEKIPYGNENRIKLLKKR